MTQEGVKRSMDMISCLLLMTLATRYCGVKKVEDDIKSLIGPMMRVGGELPKEQTIGAWEAFVRSGKTTVELFAVK
jgi:hypothetical protein